MSPPPFWAGDLVDPENLGLQDWIVNYSLWICHVYSIVVNDGYTKKLRGFEDIV